MRNKFIFEAFRDPKATPEERPKILSRQGEITAFLDGKKLERKDASAAANVRLNSDLKIAHMTSSKDNHPALLTFEKAILSIGSETITDIKNSLGKDKKFENLLFGPTQNSRTEVFENYEYDASSGKPKPQTNDPNTRLIGRILEGNDRFMALQQQPPGAKNRVFQRKNDTGLTGRHYIALSLGGEIYFVRRFVIRGLSGQNTLEIKRNTPLTAAREGTTIQFNEQRTDGDPDSKTKFNKKAGAELNIREQIISHARGWNKRFISTGAGSRAPISTRGTTFQSLFGNVAIDLAYIEAKNIIDLHSPVVLKWLNLDASAVIKTKDDHYPAKNHDDEVFLALRDVLRTRELLIQDNINLAYVKGRVATVGNVLALGFPSFLGKEIKDIQAGVAYASGIFEKAKSSELTTLDYTALDSRKWAYFQYESAKDCQDASNYVEQLYTEYKGSKRIYREIINSYETPRIDELESNPGLSR